MIAKVRTGSSFALALSYGAGELGSKNKKEKKDKVELISRMNILSKDHAGIAAEMEAVIRDHPSRCKQHVLHLILAAPAGTELTKKQWLQASNMYVKALGISINDHQAVIYQHHDREHPHLHIYINRIPLDGGKAISTTSSYIKSVKAARQIEKTLGIRVLTEKEEYQAKKKAEEEQPKTVNELRTEIQQKQGVTGELARLISGQIVKSKAKTPEQLVDSLKAVKVEATILANKKGISGIIFDHPEYGHFKGTALGLKWGTVAKMLAENAGQEERPIEIKQLQQKSVEGGPKPETAKPIGVDNNAKDEEFLLHMNTISAILRMTSEELQEFWLQLPKRARFQIARFRSTEKV